MASEKGSKVKARNFVKVVGYLKENNLESVVNSSGDNIIRGSLVVATNSMSSYKISFYVSDELPSGEENKDYAKLCELLPTNTVTVASYLKNNPNANFEMASNAATKVWVTGRMEEFASKSGERETSILMIKGSKAGFSKLGTTPFEPCATFDIDVFINNIEEEVNTENESTGRLLIEGLVPKYNGAVDKIKFIGVAEDGVASYIGANYAIQDTVNLQGDLVCIQERVISEQEDEDNHFGRVNSGPQYNTKFVRENRVYGGSKTPIHQGEEKSISLSFIKTALAKREEKMIENGERAKKGQTGAATPRQSEQKSFTRPVGMDSDIDF